MQIKTLQKKYVQKSKIFMYPHLGVKKGHSIIPTATYLCWKDMYEVKDQKVIATYHLRDDKAFKLFEEVKLLKNPKFHDFFELENGLGAYVFDFSDDGDDYKKIINGQYSKLSDDFKKVILDYFRTEKAYQVRLASYLKPDKYIKTYSELLNVSEEIIREVGELCNKPDIEKETLTVSKKIINLQ